MGTTARTVGGGLVIIAFLPYVEMLLVPLIIGMLFAERFNSSESGWISGIVSLIILGGLYFSRFGKYYSLVFSGLWGYVAGAICREAQWSWVGTLIVGGIIFAISYGIHEFHRDKVKSSAAEALAE